MERRVVSVVAGFVHRDLRAADGAADTKPDFVRHEVLPDTSEARFEERVFMRPRLDAIDNGSAMKAEDSFQRSGGEIRDNERARPGLEHAADEQQSVLGVLVAERVDGFPIVGVVCGIRPELERVELFIRETLIVFRVTRINRVRVRQPCNCEIFKGRRVVRS